MNTKNDPIVSIGLPVYNGENFLEDALNSFLAQTFKDFELIISDNASTDRTQAICDIYAAKDNRIKYVRNPENIGASGNYTKVFELSTGKYFKWAAHDDICRPDFLLRCVEVLDRDPSVVLCYTRTITIDSDGRPGKKWNDRPEFSSGIPHKRFREVFAPVETFPIWGIMRADILRRTPLLGDYPGHDFPLLTELSLYGRFYEIPEFLFFLREHNHRSVRLYDFRDPYQAIAWYNPKKAGKIIFPAWKLFAEHLAGINRAPITWSERRCCYIEMIKWIKHNKSDLHRDLIVAASHIYGIGPIIKKINDKYQESSWENQVKQLALELKSLIPAKDTFILADNATFNTDIFARWRIVPFIERDGQYWGPPPSDNTAIRELERMRQSGAKFFVFGWPAFWWLDHYVEFYRYLRSRFHCVRNDDLMVLFDLRADKHK